MSEAKYTPGPWHAAHVGDGGRNDEPIYDICDDHNWRLAQYVNEANARLIAAAPELLGALQALVDDAFVDVPDGKSIACRYCGYRTEIGQGHIHNDVCRITKVENAIAKATEVQR